VSRLPEELQVALKAGRHCSGCGCLFVGPAAVDVLGTPSHSLCCWHDLALEQYGCHLTQPVRGGGGAVWVPIGATGLPILGRYCSVRCWREEEADARKRIDVVPQPLSDEDD
jgi:hypothetical protein